MRCMGLNAAVLPILKDHLPSDEVIKALGNIGSPTRAVVVITAALAYSFTRQEDNEAALLR
eukprot:scaffold306771_cov15-Prasinocladus_malaysianus.AAC.1